MAQTLPHDPAQPWPNTSKTAGLTKREYMATHILAGIAKTDTVLTPDELGAEAVSLTDALIRALNVPTKQHA